MTPPECVILVGLQAAGKTSFYRERFASTHLHVSKDNFPHARNRDDRQRSLIDDALARTQSVVVDNTNSTPAERRGPIELAKGHGARVVCYYFPPDTRTSVGRNRRREGKPRVPDVAIFATAKRFVPPCIAEGFDAIYTVNLTDEGRFEVSRYEERPAR